MTALVGQPAPAFERQAHDGSTIRVGDEARDRILVLYFYPADHSPGCTMEACGFRDAFEDFIAYGADVVGVSPDPLETHRSFIDRYNLPFRLISDTDLSLRSAYGATFVRGLLPGRVTFVIDTDNIIRHRFSGLLRFHVHVSESLRIVRELSHGDQTARESL